MIDSKKILICFGTRPEAIKMAPVIRELKKQKVKISICVTAQHREMLDQVLEFFELKPDIDMNLMKQGQSLNSLSAEIFNNFDEVLSKELPDLVLVHGDTTTSVIVSMATFHKGIKIAHVEAGLRTYDRNSPFPEEINRQLTARLASLHFAPTLQAKENLLKENISEENIFITGNTVVDSLNWGINKLEEMNSSEIDNFRRLLPNNKKVILVTGHRRENFSGGLESISRALVTLASIQNLEIVFPVHLNPHVLQVVNKRLSGISNIHLLKPVNYPEMLWLMNRCDLIITDSGGVQEEAPTFKKPVLVTREVSERMEGVEAGFAFVVGTKEELIVQKSKDILKNPLDLEKYENPYGDGKASKRIADCLANLNF